jgi:hypothetical protein
VSFTGDPLEDASAVQGFLSGSQSTTMIVLRSDEQTATILSWINEPGVFNSLFQASQIGARIHYVQGDVAADTINVAGPGQAVWDLNEFHVLTLTRDGASGQIRFDGTPLGGQAGSFVNPIVTGEEGTLRIGGLAGDPSDLWTGDIAEIRVYNNVPANLNEIEVQLGNDYGISVVPEPSEYAMIFGLACVAGAVALRYRRQQLAS